MIIQDADIILPRTLQLLEQLQQDVMFKDYFLVGGTALALQIGHRLSIDLDLFTQTNFDTQILQNHLSINYGFYADFIAPNTLKGFIEDVKVDFITHPYPLVQALIEEEAVRLASIVDIAAMKLNAIAHSGNRQKDFYDMYFLLEQISLKTMLDAFQEKYPRANPVVPLKGLTYFEDIDFEIEYPVLKRQVSFDEVKARLTAATLNPDYVY